MGDRELTAVITEVIRRDLFTPEQAEALDALTDAVIPPSELNDARYLLTMRTIRSNTMCIVASVSPPVELTNTTTTVSVSTS